MVYEIEFSRSVDQVARLLLDAKNEQEARDMAEIVMIRHPENFEWNDSVVLDGPYTLKVEER